MADLLCENCGSTLNVPEGAVEVECSSCGSKHSVPQPEVPENASVVEPEVTDSDEAQTPTTDSDEAQTDMTDSDEVETATTDSSENETVNDAEKAFIDDGYAALGYNYFDAAHSAFNKAIIVNETSVEARIGKLLANLKCTCEEDLGNLKETFEGNDYFFEVLKYADNETAERLSNYNILILNRQAQDEIDKKNAVALENAKKQSEEIKEIVKEIKKREKKRHGFFSFRTFFNFAVGAALVWFLILSPMDKYKKAVELFDSGDYVAAYTAFEELGKFSDSEIYIMRCSYNIARNSSDYPGLSRLLSRMDKNSANLLYNEIVANEYTPRTDYNSLVANGSEVYAIKTDGTLFAAGNIFNVLKTRKWMDLVSIVSDGTNIYCLKGNGTVVSTADYLEEEFSERWFDIVQLFYTNSGHLIGLKDDGTVISTTDYYNFNDWTDIVQVVGTGTATFGLKTDGTVLVTGTDEYDLYEASEWTNVVRMWACGLNVFGLKSNGKVLATGRNEDDVCLVEDWSDIVDIQLTESNAFGLKEDGTIVVSGAEITDLSISEWNDIVGISVEKRDYAPCITGIKADGTVVIAGNIKSGAKTFYVGGWTDVVSVSIGHDIIAGIKSDGTIVTTGIEKTEGAKVDIGLGHVKKEYPDAKAMIQFGLSEYDSEDSQEA